MYFKVKKMYPMLPSSFLNQKKEEVETPKNELKEDEEIELFICMILIDETQCYATSMRHLKPKNLPIEIKKISWERVIFSHIYDFGFDPNCFCNHVQHLKVEYLNTKKIHTPVKFEAKLNISSDVLLHIVEFLDVRSLPTLKLVSKEWNILNTKEFLEFKYIQNNLQRVNDLKEFSNDLHEIYDKIESDLYSINMKKKILNLSLDFDINRAEKTEPDVHMDECDDNNLISYCQHQEFTISFNFKNKYYDFYLINTSYTHYLGQGIPKDFSDEICYRLYLNSKEFDSNEESISFTENEKIAIFGCLYLFDSLDLMISRPELSPNKLPIKIQVQPWERVFQIVDNFEEHFPKCFCGHPRLLSK
jgi:hypothetical protein